MKKDLLLIYDTLREEECDWSDQLLTKKSGQNWRINKDH